MNVDHARTLSIVTSLSQGKIIEIDGYIIGMAEDMSIGAVATNDKDEKSILGLSTMDLAQFNNLLNKHNIGFSI